MIEKFIKFILSFFKGAPKVKTKTVFKDYFLTAFDLEIVSEISKYRMENNLCRLEVSTELAKVAFANSERIAIPGQYNHDYFVDRAAEFPKKRIAEILLKGCVSVASHIASWKRSVKHNEAMLKPYFKYIAVAMVVGEDGKKYVTCLFSD